MSPAFLITSPYQVYHYKWIAPHFDGATALIEQRDQEYGLTPEFVREHMDNCSVRSVKKEDLRQLDGTYDAIVCQTPILPLEFLERTYVVAQQYSMAKEVYQYGVWRAHAHLNLMYGEYSRSRVEGFCNAVAVGNPLLDPYFDPGVERPSSALVVGRRPKLLYMPTYGELSSTRAMLPKLAQVDADVTIKLHHAEAIEARREFPHGWRVVLAEADPVALLQEHDGVISDFSGAAFDALCAGVPVVVTGVVDTSSKDAERLSSGERNYELLRDVAEIWHGEGDVLDALVSAGKRLETEAYATFRERLYVNLGSAGAACAEEIRRLMEDGVPEHFAASQVRATTKRYIIANRELRGVRRPDQGGGGAPRRPVPAQSSTAKLLYRRTRRLLAKSGPLRRAVRGLRRQIRGRRRNRPEMLYPLPAPGPAARREEVLDVLLAYFQRAGVSLLRDNDQGGSDVAVAEGDKSRVLEALKSLRGNRPDLAVRVGVDWRIVETLPIDRVRWIDIADAHWLEIGTAGERSPYHIGTSGYLTVLFIFYDSEKNRYLALKRRARRTDWTDLVKAGGEATTAEVVRAVGSRPCVVADPIDVVYTWVDSGDPEWRRAHRRYSEEDDVSIPSANNEERYTDREELRHSLRTLWMFAPFVRNIYIVTANQFPSWLTPDHPRIRVVPHSEIFPDVTVLPTFNSHAIESCLHRIPGLSDYFLYFNDDVFLGREVTARDFFTLVGLAKVRLSPSQYIYQGIPESAAIPTDWAAYNTVSLLQQQTQLVFDRRIQHVPMALRHDVLNDIEERYPAELARTRGARFRSVTDVAVPSMLAQFYGVATGRAVEWPPANNEYVYLDTGRRDSVDRFDQILRVRPKFFCLNATRHGEIGLADQARNVRRFLSTAFPSPAPWERGA